MARCGMSRTRSIPALPQEMLFNSCIQRSMHEAHHPQSRCRCEASELVSQNAPSQTVMTLLTLDISTCGGGVLNVGEGSVAKRVHSEGGVRFSHACSCRHGMEMARPAECLHTTRQVQHCATVRRLCDPCNTKHPFHLYPFAQTRAHLTVWNFRCRNGLQGEGPGHIESCPSFATAHRPARLNISKTTISR